MQHTKRAPAALAEKVDELVGRLKLSQDRLLTAHAERHILEKKIEEQQDRYDRTLDELVSLALNQVPGE